MQPQIDLIHDAQDAEKVVQDVKQGVAAVKEGYKTTEFWVMIVSQVGILSNIPDSSSRVQLAQAAMSGLVAIAYAAFRTYLKSVVRQL